MDIVQISVWIPDQASLGVVLSAAHVELDCGPPKRDERGLFKITLYASTSEAAKIAALPYEHKIDQNFGKVLAERQREVSKTDRFQGGKVKPTGLGVKV